MTGLDFSRTQKLALLVLIGLSAIGLSVSHMRDSMRGTSEVVLQEPGAPGEPRAVASDSDPMPGYSPAANTSKVVFQVAGCVNRPGVYSLAEGKRVVDAISAAGGAKPNADTQAINLAEKITDGSRIYLPPKGQATASAGAISGGVTIKIASNSSPLGSNKLSMPSQGAVNINSADVSELERLPGVGPSTAQKIADYRAQIGRFTNIDQLMDVKGIGPKKLDKMRPFVSL